MDILDYESTVRPEWWLKQIGDCDWAGARYLYTLLTENRFHELCGEKARLGRQNGKGDDQEHLLPVDFLPSLGQVRRGNCGHVGHLR